MTNSPHHLYDTKRTLGTRARVGNGNALDILCKGTLDFRNKKGNRVKLYDVLYVPGLSCNLVSIGKLQQRSLTTTFTGSSSSNKNFAFIKTKAGRRYLSVKLEASLYKMEMQRTKEQCLQETHPTATMEILHQRLAHVSYRKIREMRKILASQKIIIEKGKSTATASCCKGCAQGKLHRYNALTTRNHPATEP